MQWNTGDRNDSMLLLNFPKGCQKVSQVHSKVFVFPGLKKKTEWENIDVHTIETERLWGQVCTWTQFVVSWQKKVCRTIEKHREMLFVNNYMHIIFCCWLYHRNWAMQTCCKIYSNSSYLNLSHPQFLISLIHCTSTMSLFADVTLCCKSSHLSNPWLSKCFGYPLGCLYKWGCTILGIKSTFLCPLSMLSLKNAYSCIQVQADY